MTAIVDYGVGNLFSLSCSLSYIGEEAKITGDRREIIAADRIILPGVGAFGDAAGKLTSTGLGEAVREAARAGKPLLGICLGMQLLFEYSEEFGRHEGLGLLRGHVVPVSLRPGFDARLKIPHIGWNPLIIMPGKPLLKYTSDGDCVYFVHSYCAVGCDESLAAVTEYSVPLTAAVQKDNICGCQFHPEKSGNTGLDILRAFCGKDRGARQC